LNIGSNRLFRNELVFSFFKAIKGGFYTRGIYSSFSGTLSSRVVYYFVYLFSFFFFFGFFKDAFCFNLVISSSVNFYSGFRLKQAYTMGHLGKILPIFSLSSI